MYTSNVYLLSYYLNVYVKFVLSYLKSVLSYLSLSLVSVYAAIPTFSFIYFPLNLQTNNPFFSSRFGLKWVERRSQIDYRAHTPGQLVNHIPNNDCITTKAALLSTLREKYCRVAPTSTTRLPTPWLPETYQLDSPSDIAAIFEMENQMMIKKQAAQGQGLAEGAQGDTPLWGCLWIYKPSCNNRGRGIRVIRGKEALELVCYGKNTGDPETSIPPSAGILQRYIENPLLAGEEGCKFDVRCYLLVARNDPSYVAYYHPG